MADVAAPSGHGAWTYVCCKAHASQPNSLCSTMIPSHLAQAQPASRHGHPALHPLPCVCNHHHQGWWQQPHQYHPGCCAGKTPWHLRPVGLLAATAGGRALRPWSAGTRQQTQSAAGRKKRIHQCETYQLAKPNLLHNPHCLLSSSLGSSPAEPTASFLSAAAAAAGV